MLRGFICHKDSVTSKEAADFLKSLGIGWGSYVSFRLATKDEFAGEFLNCVVSPEQFPHLTEVRDKYYCWLKDENDKIILIP